jgi:AraC family transcriptional regulator of adaptative response/methylated-DNA-[protein]-cysteine methyltransferase
MKNSRSKKSNDGNAQLVQALARYIEAHANEHLPLEALARQAHLSPTHLQRTFKATLGLSPKAFQDAARMRLLKGALKAGKSLLDSMGDAGFQSTSRVYGSAARSLGMKPSNYRAGGAGECIAYAVRNTSLGPLLMAATERGVCFAQFGRGETDLVAQLRSEFPKATIEPSGARLSPELDAWMAGLERHISGFAPRPELPLDLRGTAFQVQVWKFLLGLPDGAVLSYGELAKGIGAPKAVRAAASACAANRIAVLVPCHRVLRGDGGLGGYRWGLERKRALIDAERRLTAA